MLANLLYNKKWVLPTLLVILSPVAPPAVVRTLDRSPQQSKNAVSRCALIFPAAELCDIFSRKIAAVREVTPPASESRKRGNITHSLEAKLFLLFLFQASAVPGINLPPNANMHLGHREKVLNVRVKIPRDS